MADLECDIGEHVLAVLNVVFNGGFIWFSTGHGIGGHWDSTLTIWAGIRSVLVLYTRPTTGRRTLF